MGRLKNLAKKRVVLTLDYKPGAKISKKKRKKTRKKISKRLGKLTGVKTIKKGGFKKFEKQLGL